MGPTKPFGPITGKKREYLGRSQNIYKLKTDNEKQNLLRATSYPSELASLAKVNFEIINKGVDYHKDLVESTQGDTGIEISQRCSASSFDEIDILGQSEFSLKRQKQEDWYNAPQ